MLIRLFLRMRLGGSFLLLRISMFPLSLYLPRCVCIQDNLLKISIMVNSQLIVIQRRLRPINLQTPLPSTATSPTSLPLQHDPQRQHIPTRRTTPTPGNPRPNRLLHRQPRPRCRPATDLQHRRPIGPPARLSIRKRDVRVRAAPCRVLV